MKYIRTKDGKIIKNNWYSIMDAPASLYNNVLDQADTIEELCDEFVVIGYKMKNPFIFSKEGIGIDEFWKHSPSDTIVYGAIWTDKGLIYVAKMNEKGCLELL